MTGGLACGRSAGRARPGAAGRGRPGAGGLARGCRLLRCAGRGCSGGSRPGGAGGGCEGHGGPGAARRGPAGGRATRSGRGPRLRRHRARRRRWAVRPRDPRGHPARRTGPRGVRAQGGDCGPCARPRLLAGVRYLDRGITGRRARRASGLRSKARGRGTPGRRVVGWHSGPGQEAGRSVGGAGVQSAAGVVVVLMEPRPQRPRRVPRPCRPSRLPPGSGSRCPRHRPTAGSGRRPPCWPRPPRQRSSTPRGCGRTGRP